MARKLKLDIPGPDLRVAPEDVRAKGWAASFGRAPAGLHLVVEIGFGRGEFGIELARAHPEIAYVGIELAWKRVHKQARRLAKDPLSNMRLLHGRGEELLELFAADSLEAVWINFPDPWPKKRHQRRRLVQPRIVASIAERLAPGGLLHVATDDPGYAEHIDAVLAAEPRLANAFAPARWLAEVPGRPPTAYELEWRALGRALHFWAYAKVVR